MIPGRLGTNFHDFCLEAHERGIAPVNGQPPGMPLPPGPGFGQPTDHKPASEDAAALGSGSYWIGVMAYEVFWVHMPSCLFILPASFGR